MNTAAPSPHPCTLLGAARAVLEPADDAHHLRLKALAAGRLGYQLEAHRLWEALAQAGDTEAVAQLRRLDNSICQS
jgi:hypothetical protein